MTISNREKIIIILVAMSAVLLLSFPIFINPLKNDVALIDRKIEAKRSEINELTRLKKDYETLLRTTKSMENKIAKSAKNVTLPSLLEKVANATNLKANMTGLKANETIKNRNFEENEVEITLKNISLDQMMDFIFKLESELYIIKIKGFKIKTTYGKEPKLINLTLMVSLFTPN